MSCFTFNDFCTRTECATNEFCETAAQQGISCVTCAGGMQAAVQVDGKEIAVTGNNGMNVNELNIQTVILLLVVFVMIISLLVMLIRNFFEKCGLTNWQYKHISESANINSIDNTISTIDDEADQNEKKFQHVILI